MKFLLLLNALFTASASLCAQAFPRYSIIIHEIYPDPSPSVGLPSAEFVELRNRSSETVNLKNWKLSDGSSSAAITADIFLAPDSLIILCAASNVAHWSPYGRALGVSNFPSLNNEGDQLMLLAPDNSTVHALTYSLGWYRNAVKELGGWTLEMINPSYPCSGSDNWTASNAPNGGTPGKMNSPHIPVADLLPPLPLHSVTIDPQHVLLHFNEPLDSTNVHHFSRFSIEPSLAIDSVQLVPPFFASVRIALSAALRPDTTYTFILRELTDCAGNKMTASATIPMGIPAPAQKGDIIFNELLFDPKPGKYDFAELYNRSKRIIDLSELYIGNRTVTGGILQPIAISRIPRYIFPGTYFALTENAEALTGDYPDADRWLMLEPTGLPSMPDDKGGITLATASGTLIDGLAYDASWHFPLLTDTEGVSLERIDPLGETQEPNNWTSAASLQGFATPTRKNSQLHNIRQKNTQVYLEPSVFSPDNDGINDLLGIHYSTNAPGHLMQIKVFDIQGRQVANPIPQATLPQRGTVWWNGVNSSQNPLPPGNYIVWVEMLHPGGKVSHFKFTAALCRRT